MGVDNRITFNEYAIIINVKRDPVATCWSNFKTNFDDEQLTFIQRSGKEYDLFHQKYE